MRRTMPTVRLWAAIASGKGGGNTMNMIATLNLRKMVVPGAVMLAFWSLGTVMWRSSGEIMALVFFGYIGNRLV